METTRKSSQKIKVTPKNLCENFDLWSDFEASFVSTDHSYILSLTYYT